ncbi:MAG: hypothetical protein AAB038_02895 [Planctomycetota bacterium]
MDLTYASVIVAIISLLVNLFLLWDRRKLKIFDIDKKLKLVDIKTEEVQIKYKAEKIKLPTEMGRRGLTGSSLAQTKSKELEQEEQRELNKLNIEKEHLLKLKSYRFPWN